MITREQYLARCDQELANARSELDRVIETYTRNMEHIATCPNCDEVDNVATLVKILIDDESPIGRNATYVALMFAVAVKAIYELRKRVRELELEALAK